MNFGEMFDPEFLENGTDFTTRIPASNGSTHVLRQGGASARQTAWDVAYETHPDVLLDTMGLAPARNTFRRTVAEQGCALILEAEKFVRDKYYTELGESMLVGNPGEEPCNE